MTAMRAEDIDRMRELLSEAAESLDRSPYRSDGAMAKKIREALTAAKGSSA